MYNNWENDNRAGNTKFNWTELGSTMKAHWNDSEEVSSTPMDLKGWRDRARRTSVGSARQTQEVRVTCFQDSKNYHQNNFTHNGTTKYAKRFIGMSAKNSTSQFQNTHGNTNRGQSLKIWTSCSCTT